MSARITPTLDNKCKSCGIPYIEHLGLVGTCAALSAEKAKVLELTKTLEEACSHIEDDETRKDFSPSPNKPEEEVTAKQALDWLVEKFDNQAIFFCKVSNGVNIFSCGKHYLGETTLEAVRNAMKTKSD